MTVNNDQKHQVDERFVEIDDDLADTGAESAYEFRPQKEDLNERLDKYLANQLPELSRTYLQQLIEDGKACVDGVPRKRTFKMTPGEVITVLIPPPVEDQLIPEAIPLDIIYEDTDVIVIDKRAGMVVHPAPGHPRGTLANAVLAHAPEIAIAGSNRPGIVHRLDKDTSGLIVVAKTDRARTSLVKQWNQRTVEKRYLALVAGEPEDEQATIDVPIRRDPVARNRMAAMTGGRPAVSHFSIKQRFGDCALLDVEIETGRTHQIRVHLAYIGHPVVGDPVYNRGGGRYGGANSLSPRTFLHASVLAIDLPDGNRVRFESPLPDDLQIVLDTLEVGLGAAP